VMEGETVLAATDMVPKLLGITPATTELAAMPIRTCVILGRVVPPRLVAVLPHKGPVVVFGKI
jgi:hypothetical protein